MMRRAYTFGAVAAAALMLPATTAAQLAAPVAVTAPHGPPIARESTAAPAPAMMSRSGTHRLLRVAGGMVLGSALGYFTSQIRMSNWDSRANSTEGHALRRQYVISGAAVGAVAGMLMPSGSNRATLPPRKSSRDMLLPRDLAATGANNAYDAVRSLRPTWLQVREVLSLGQAVGGAAAAASGTEVTGDVAILVYLDRAKMGGIESLRDIDLSVVRSIEFFNGTESTYRWGWGHAHGVVYVSTTDPTP